MDKKKFNWYTGIYIHLYYQTKVFFMIEISAISKYEKMGKILITIRYLLIIAFGGGAMWFLISQYGNVLGALVLFISLIAVLILASLPPRTIVIRLDNSGIEIDGQVFEWNNLLFWVMVDMDETVECVIQTSGIMGGNKYFYVKKSDEKFSEFSMALAEYAPYNESLAAEDLTHRMLKSLHLK